MAVAVCRLKGLQVVDEVRRLTERQRVELHPDDVDRLTVGVDVQSPGDGQDGAALRRGHVAVAATTTSIAVANTVGVTVSGVVPILSRGRPPVVAARASRLRVHPGLTVKCRLGLREEVVDLALQLVGFGQQRLVEFRSDVDRAAGGLVVLAGLAAGAALPSAPPAGRSTAASRRRGSA